MVPFHYLFSGVSAGLLSCFTLQEHNSFIWPQGSARNEFSGQDAEYAHGAIHGKAWHETGKIQQ